METQCVFFSIWDHHKWPNSLFPLHLNTYIMGVRSLEIFKFFQCAGTVFIRQDLTYTDVRFWRIKTVTALKGSGAPGRFHDVRVLFSLCHTQRRTKQQESLWCVLFLRGGPRPDCAYYKASIPNATCIGFICDSKEKWFDLGWIQPHTSLKQHRAIFWAWKGEQCLLNW